jgi:hypothetical protein
MPDARPNIDASIYILEYLLDSVKCPMQKLLVDDIQDLRNYRHTIWKDTVQDSTLTPYDSVQYTLDELGLSILRKIRLDVNSGLTDPFHAWIYPVALENPFRESIRIDYTLKRGSVIRCDIFDALGRPMYSDPIGWKERGKHLLSVDTNSWNDGTYFVRFLSLKGEVKTIKIVR